MEEEDLESIFWMALAMTAIHMVLRSSILWPGCCCCWLVRKKSGNLPTTPIKCIAMSVQSNLCKIPIFLRNPDERTRGIKALFWREVRFGGTDICSDWTLRVLIESQLQNFVFYKTQEGLLYFPKMSIFVLMRRELNSFELIWVYDVPIFQRGFVWFCQNIWFSDDSWINCHAQVLMNVKCMEIKISELTAVIMFCLR